MIIVWRGFGPLALVAALLPLGSFLALIDVSILWAFAAVGGSSVLGGLVCWILGRRWNRGSVYHSLYFVPLEVWGLVYMIEGGGLVGLIVVGLIFRLLFKPGP